MDCGASEEQAEAFQAACGERFGAGAVLNPANLIDANKVELKTEKVSLSIDPEYSHLVEAKVIDGQKVLIVPVEDHLEFNGVAVNVNRDKELPTMRTAKLRGMPKGVFLRLGDIDWQENRKRLR